MSSFIVISKPKKLIIETGTDRHNPEQRHNNTPENAVSQASRFTYSKKVSVPIGIAKA